MADLPTNSNTQSSGETPIPMNTPEAKVAQQLSQVATATVQGVVENINKPITISVEQVKQTYDLLNEQIEDIVEPPSARTAAFKQVLAVMKDAIRNVETTGKIQVIAITATGIVPQQLSRLEQIRADTAKANERLAREAEAAKSE